MTHFYNTTDRAVMKIFGKTEKDVLIQYGKFLARKIQKAEKIEGKEK